LNSRLQPPLVFRARNFHDAELRQVLVGELGIEQRKALLPEPRDQINQRNLARVIAAGKHAFAKKRAADGNAVNTTRQHIAIPSLNAMCETGAVQG